MRVHYANQPRWKRHGASAVVFGRVDELPPGRISQHSTSHSYARAWHVDPIADLQPG
jgi:hypothetical protein